MPAAQPWEEGWKALYCSAWAREEGDLVAVFSCLKERCKDQNCRLALQVHSGRITGNTGKHKLELQLDVEEYSQVAQRGQSISIL